MTLPRGGWLFGLAVAAAGAWLALRPTADGEPPRVHEFESMGTIVSITIATTPSTQASVGDALAALERDWRRQERDWAAWGDGALGQFNRALADGQAVAVPRPLQDLYARAAVLSRQTQGLFDVRVGALVQAWGFHDERTFRTQPPDAAALDPTLAALRAAPALDETAAAYGPAPGVRLDFGAIAKGYAVDRALDLLAARGFDDALVNAGGNLRARGSAGERPWRIGIRHPRPQDGQRLLATLEIDTDEAVVTSGDYERYFEFEGRRYHHLLDPRSGQPASELQSVTVVVPADTALADAASTALFVAGRHWPQTARALGLDQVLVVDAQGRVQATPRLAARLQRPQGSPREIETRAP